MENQNNVPLPERMKDALYHAMKALDEMRGKTLIYNKYRDTQTLSDHIWRVIGEYNRVNRVPEEPGDQKPTLSLINK